VGYSAENELPGGGLPRPLGGQEGGNDA
jgi:hypothetical protein